MLVASRTAETISSSLAGAMYRSYRCRSNPFQLDQRPVPADPDNQVFRVAVLMVSGEDNANAPVVTIAEATAFVYNAVLEVRSR